MQYRYLYQSQLQSGQIVVLDNLPAHKSPKIDELIHKAGCIVLPGVCRIVLDYWIGGLK